MTLSTWHERLKAERERLWPRAQGSAADAFGIQRETMSRYESGAVKPGLDALLRIAQGGVDVLYVITGRRESKATALSPLPNQEAAEPPPTRGGMGRQERPVRPDTTHMPAPLLGGFTLLASGGLLAPAAGRDGPPLRLPIAFDGGRTSREFQVIPRYKGAASAGRSAPESGDTHGVDAAGVLAMDRKFMRDQLGSDKASFVTVEVKGDSMERTLIDGETIIIDSDVTEVDANGIYVVRVGKALLVKRLVLQMDGSVLVKSDNPAYSEYDRSFSPEQMMGVDVVGRMVWPKFR